MPINKSSLGWGDNTTDEMAAFLHGSLIYNVEKFYLIIRDMSNNLQLTILRSITAGVRLVNVDWESVGVSGES